MKRLRALFGSEPPTPEQAAAASPSELAGDPALLCAALHSASPALPWADLLTPSCTALLQAAQSAGAAWVKPITTDAHAASIAASAASAPVGQTGQTGQTEPSGPSLEYDPQYASLQSKLRPAAEVQYGTFTNKREGPDWAELEREAQAMLLRSHDIGLLVVLCRARARRNGAAGLLQGLWLLHSVLSVYADTVHPQREIDGELDLGVRANALAALTDPEGLLGDLADLVVCKSTVARLSLRDVSRSQAIPRQAMAHDAAQVARQLFDLHQKSDPLLLQLLLCAALMLRIEALAKAQLGAEAPQLGALTKLLLSCSCFAPLLLAHKAKEAQEAQEAALDPKERRSAANAKRSGASPEAFNGLPTFTAFLSSTAMSNAASPQEREHIRSLLRQVRQWIEQHEPSSPVVLLLRQSERLWGQPFHKVAAAIPPDLLAQWSGQDPFDGAAQFVEPSAANTSDTSDS